jgi:glutamate-1-semialdehyde 2,1-aminomutase
MPYARCAGHPARAIIKLTVPDGVSGVTALEMKTLVQQEMVARGVLWSGFHNLSYAHRDADIARVLGAYRETLPLLREAVRAGDVKRRLRGKVLEGVFRKIENVMPKTKK